MGIFDNSPNNNPFRASVRLSQAEIIGYVESALSKEGCSNVKVEFDYNENGAAYDRFATPTLNIRLTVTRDGKPETKTISQELLCQTVAAEIIADGNMLATDSVNKIGVSISYSSTERLGDKVTGSMVLLVPRKRS